MFNKKRSGTRINPVELHTVPASENSFSSKTKIFLSETHDSNQLLTEFSNPTNLILENFMVKFAQVFVCLYLSK